MKQTAYKAMRLAPRPSDPDVGKAAHDAAPLEDEPEETTFEQKALTMSDDDIMDALRTRASSAAAVATFMAANDPGLPVRCHSGAVQLMHQTMLKVMVGTATCTVVEARKILCNEVCANVCAAMPESLDIVLEELGVLLARQTLLPVLQGIEEGPMGSYKAILAKKLTTAMWKVNGK